MIFCEHWYWSPSSIDKGIVLMQQIEINNKNIIHVETHIIALIRAQSFNNADKMIWVNGRKSIKYNNALNLMSYPLIIVASLNYWYKRFYQHHQYHLYYVIKCMIKISFIQWWSIWSGPMYTNIKVNKLKVVTCGSSWKERRQKELINIRFI